MYDENEHFCSNIKQQNMIKNSTNTNNNSSIDGSLVHQKHLAFFQLYIFFETKT